MPFTPRNATALAPLRRAVAQTYTRSAALASGLGESYLAGLYVAKEYRTAHNGVTHLVYRQQFQGVDVYNVEWTVNIDSDGQVLNAGGSLASAPAPGISSPGRAGAAPAFEAALHAIRPKALAAPLPPPRLRASRSGSLSMAGCARLALRPRRERRR